MVAVVPQPVIKAVKEKQKAIFGALLNLNMGTSVTSLSSSLFQDMSTHRAKAFLRGLTGMTAREGRLTRLDEN